MLVERGCSGKAYNERSRCVDVAQCVEMEVLWDLECVIKGAVMVQATTSLKCDVGYITMI